MKHPSQLLQVIIICLFGLAPGFAQSQNFLPTLNTKEKRQIEAGDIVMREVKLSSDKGLSMEIIGLVECSGETLFHLLTDYEAYPEYMSALDTVDIISQDSAVTTLNYILKPMLGVVKRYRLDHTAVQLDPLTWKVAWEMVPWPGLEPMQTLADTKGHWLILHQSEQRTLVEYYVYSDPGSIPFGLGGIVDALGKNSMKNAFMETRQKAVSTAGGKDSRSSSP